MWLICSEFSKIDLNNSSTLFQTTKYKTVVKNKFKNRVQNTLSRINLVLEISKTCAISMQFGYPHRRSTTVSLETFTLYSISMRLSLWLNILCFKGIAKESIQNRVETFFVCKPLITTKTGIDRAKIVGLLHVTWITVALH